LRWSDSVTIIYDTNDIDLRQIVVRYAVREYPPN